MSILTTSNPNHSRPIPNTTGKIWGIGKPLAISLESIPARILFTSCQCSYALPRFTRFALISAWLGTYRFLLRKNSFPRLSPVLALAASHVLPPMQPIAPVTWRGCRIFSCQKVLRNAANFTFTAVYSRSCTRSLQNRLVQRILLNLFLQNDASMPMLCRHFADAMTQTSFKKNEEYFL